MKFFTPLALASLAIAAPLVPVVDTPGLAIPKSFIPESTMTDSELLRRVASPSRTRAGGGSDTVNKLAVETFKPTTTGIKKKIPPRAQSDLPSTHESGPLASPKIPRILIPIPPSVEAIKTAGLNIVKDISTTVKQKLKLLPRILGTDASALGEVENIARDLSYDDLEYSQAVKDFLKARQVDGLDSFTESSFDEELPILKTARDVGFIGQEDGNAVEAC
ncbi:hypothetical protein F5X68DRAFT_226350 [Plectosphaerella plurivora]|uniref:Uncharacterized protein n=1 Tax=Plectosphaerella plurivora TaxID=936078 RepID=A0A9P8VMP0_9PEZI|nr:hypothetical protein F5X68DRAFT_226350 [Plectosphaerella plurivora]